MFAGISLQERLGYSKNLKQTRAKFRMYTGCSSSARCVSDQISKAKTWFTADP